MNEKKEAMDVLSGMRGISIRLGANIVLLASFRSFFFTNGKFFILISCKREGFKKFTLFSAD